VWVLGAIGCWGPGDQAIFDRVCTTWHGGLHTGGQSTRGKGGQTWMELGKPGSGLE